MPKKLNIESGKVFNRLTVITEVEPLNKQRRFKCRCECGNISTHKMVLMVNGQAKSCGCKKREHLINLNSKHGLSRTKLNAVWQSMKQRCLNPNHKSFHHYGGRGVSVCEEWLDLTSFCAWAKENGYKEGLTLERKDVHGNYEPSNCEWTTMKVQNRNRRDNNFIKFNGEELCMQDWADRIGIKRCTLDKRLKKWPIEKALTTPKIER